MCLPRIPPRSSPQSFAFSPQPFRAPGIAKKGPGHEAAAALEPEVAQTQPQYASATGHYPP